MVSYSFISSVKNDQSYDCMGSHWRSTVCDCCVCLCVSVHVRMNSERLWVTVDFLLFEVDNQN